MDNNISLAGIASLIAEKNKILLITHIKPDGDTLGSAYGLLHALDGFADVRVICAHNVPKRLMFISDDESELNEERLEDFSPELIIALDAAELLLMGSYGENYAEAIDLKIDHHPTGARYARYNYIDGTAAATAEIVYAIIRELISIGGARMNEKAASALYAAIVSDTGGFRYSNVTPSTLRIGAELMETGAVGAKICEQLFEHKSASEMVALKLALNNMTVYRKGTVAVVTVTEELRKNYGLYDEDFGDIINVLRSIDGVVLAVTLRQQTDQQDKYRISMRSGEGVSAAKLCGMLNGGGHERAAGGWVNAGTAAEAEYKVTSLILGEIGYEP